METQIRNAVIENTMLGYEDHGILTCFLYLNYGGAGQGFGGYGLDSYDNETEKGIGTAYGLAFIIGILNVLEVDKWESLKGIHCRADTKRNKVHGIGHILKDQWFYPQKDLAKYLPEGEE